jgi:tetratricopeptide (TPR) repeat protein
MHIMQQTIGEFIRQTRRQQNITQTELGGTRFSKSYVSAVERNKITASSQALTFFAEQLHQPRDYFTSLLQQVGHREQIAVFNHDSSLNTGNGTLTDQSLTLLGILLENTELSSISLQYELPPLSTEVVATLPPPTQARYYFFIGLSARNKQNLAAALYAFEYALALTPTSQRSVILDELGLTYYLMQIYHTALGYHLRALSLLTEPLDEFTKHLRCKVELHCADDYRALGVYPQAREHYEQARHYLRTEHDLQTAGLVYLGLGCCTYFAINQRTSLTLPTATRATFGEMEHQFQQAINFLIQAKNIYQISSDPTRLASTRLVLATAELNFCTRQRQMQPDKAKATGRKIATTCTSLLKDAEEQCRQVLLSWQNLPSEESTPTDLDAIIYTALAYLVRILIQQARLARLDGYTETALLERAKASYLCQQILNSLTKGSLPWALIRHALALQTESIAYKNPSLPHLPELGEDMDAFPHNSYSQVEVYFAAAEVAEELSHLSTTEEFCYDCYERATQCMQAALDAARTLHEHDRNYVMRCYQRCSDLLEEHMQTVPELAPQTTRVLANTLEEELNLLQQPVLPSLYA